MGVSLPLQSDVPNQPSKGYQVYLQHEILPEQAVATPQQEPCQVSETG